MTIQKDAGEILLYVYKDYTEGISDCNTHKIIEETKWEAHKINNAIGYLYDLNILKMKKMMGKVDGVQIFFIHGINPEGVDKVENQQEFKRNFGFEVNLGLLKFSWGAEEK